MITMTRAQWLSILVPCARVASRKPVRPGDACVLVTSDHEGVRAEAGDGFTFARAFRAGAESKPVQFAVDAHAFVERVKAMRDGDVTVTPRESGVDVKGGPRKFSLPTMNVDDVMPVPLVDGERFESLDRALLEPIAIARHAASTDDTRPHVASVLVELSGTASRAVATDGHRMTVARIGNVGGDACKFLVPRNAATLLAGIPEGERVDLEVGGGLLAVTTHGDAVVTLTVKLTEAQFPPWEQVVPKDRKAKAQVSCAALSQSVQAVALAAGERSGGITLRFEDDRIALSSQSPDHGDAGDEVEADGRTGTGVPIGCNARYMLEALAAVGELAEVSAEGELDPMTVASLDGSVLCVLMPMRVG